MRGFERAFEGAINPSWLAAPALLLFILPFPHTVAARLVFLLGACVAAVACWRRLQVPRPPCLVPIALWAGISALSLAWAVDPRYTLGELKAEVGYSLMAFGAMFALSADLRRLRLFTAAIAAGFTVICGGAIVSYALRGHWPLSAWFGETPQVSQYVLAAGPATALAAVLWLGGSRSYAVAAAAAATALVVVLSGQRATWLAIALQLAVLAAWFWRRGKFSSQRYRVALLLGLAVLALGVSSTVLLRAHLEPQAALENDLRLQVWGSVAERIARHPLTGSGFGREILRKAHPDLTPPENPLFWHSHNMVLNYGLSAGVPGMVAVILLFAALGWRFWRFALSEDPALRPVGLAGVLIVAGIFGRNVFNDLFVRDGALFFWALAGALLGYAERRAAAAREPGLAST